MNVTRNVLLLLLTPLLSTSQSVTPQVVSTAGTEFYSSDVHLTWTLGESFSTTLKSESLMITQGFHQTWLLVTSMDDVEVSESVEISVYPNPTAQILHIKWAGFQADVEALLVDVNGKVLHSQRLRWEGGTSSIDMTGLATATYFLRLSAMTERLDRTFRIVKISQ